MATKKETLVVNLAGAPGAGKSTASAYIFSYLKMRGVDCELITEFAKDKVWEENDAALKNQLFVTGYQSYKQSRCYGKVDVIITDSPLFLGIFYKTPELKECFDRTIIDVFNTYNNITFFLNRVKPYNPNGRKQTEEESNRIAGEIKNLLLEHCISFETVDGDIDGCQYIAEKILSILRDRKVKKKDGVKHGKWLSAQDKDKKICSECGITHLIAQYPSGNANICPNCGTIMDLS